MSGWRDVADFTAEDAIAGPLPVVNIPAADYTDEGFTFVDGAICRAGPGGLQALTPRQAAQLLNALWRKCGELEQEVEDLGFEIQDLNDR